MSSSKRRISSARKTKREKPKCPRRTSKPRPIDCWIIKARSGDQEAALKLWAAFKKRVGTWLIWLGLPEADQLAADAFAELVVNNRLQRFDPERGGGWSFMNVAGKNKARDLLRKRNRHRPRLMSEDALCGIPATRDGDPVEQAIAREMMALVDAAIDRLAPNYRAALKLRQQGASMPEIQDTLGVSQSKAGNLVHRGIRLLRRELVKMDPVAFKDLDVNGPVRSRFSRGNRRQSTKSNRHLGEAV